MVAEKAGRMVVMWGGRQAATTVGAMAVRLELLLVYLLVASMV